MGQVAMEDERPALQKQFVAFSLQNQEYGVDIASVKEVIKIAPITPVPKSPNYILGIMNLRGRVIPVLDIESKFNLEKINPDKKHIIVIENTMKDLIGVEVDKVTEVISLSQDLIEPIPKTVFSKIPPEFVKGVVIVSKLKDQILSLNLAENKIHLKTEEYENLQAPQEIIKYRVILILDIEKVLSHDDILQITSEKSEAQAFL